MSNYSRSKNSKQKTITLTNDTQFIVEGESGNTKIGGESEYAISYIDFENGPLVHIGKDFLGRGRVKIIDIIDSSNPNYILVKITIE